MPAHGAMPEQNREAAPQLRLFNNLTRRLEVFAPRGPEVTLYACGPTVYNHVHIGNWSAFLMADTVVRWLEARGYPVKYVMNITDVEDKTIRDSRAAGEALGDFTARWAKVFLDGMQLLGCRKPDHYPLATDYIEGMGEMIQKLLDKGHAYLAEDGSIYYRISSFDTYGELANLDLSTLEAGASGRVSADEYEKESVADFALWKAYDEEDGDVHWSPTFVIDGAEKVVKGRPGWHIECSVMSSSLLGDQIDIHLGGEDLLFPHHQNEIAQSEAATGRSPFVRYWMHKRHLMVDGAKMSKSKGTFHTLEDVREKHGPLGVRAFRYLVVSAHYRSQIDFSWSGLDSAKTTLRNLDQAWQRFEAAAGDAEPSDFADEAWRRFGAAMDEDLQASEAVAAVHEIVGEANRRSTAGTLGASDAAAVVKMLSRVDAVLGLQLGLAAEVEMDAELEQLLADRATARASKDWAAADRIRDDLRARGLAVEDGPEGQKLVRI